VCVVVWHNCSIDIDTVVSNGAVMAYGYRIGRIPSTTIQRLPRYLRVLRSLASQGREVVSSARLAEVLSLDAVQVRKDFGFLQITGRPKTGFRVEELVDAIEQALCWNRVTDAVLVGVGHLGAALLGYDGFAHHGVDIVAAFDREAERIGPRVHGVSVEPMDALASRIRAMNVAMAILTVSPEGAQDVAEALVEAGIQGIWNFTGQALRVPDSVIVQDQDIAIGLALLSAKLTARRAERE